VLTEISGAGTLRVASLETEDVRTHEVVPLIRLLEVVSSRLSVGWEVVREHEGAERITALIGTVGVELSSTIVSSEVDELLVDVTSDLNVVWGLHEGDTGDSALGDDTCTTAGLSAPCDRLALGVTNG